MVRIHVKRYGQSVKLGVLRPGFPEVILPGTVCSGIFDKCIKMLRSAKTDRQAPAVFNAAVIDFDNRTYVVRRHTIDDAAPVCADDTAVGCEINDLPVSRTAENGRSCF